MTRLFYLLLLLFSFIGVTYAQSEEEEVEETPWYQVELIIFEYTDHTLTESEIWPNDPGKPDIVDSITLIPADAFQAHLAITDMAMAPKEPEATPEPTDEQLVAIEDAPVEENTPPGQTVEMTANQADAQPEQPETLTAETTTEQATNEAEEEETLPEETPFVLLEQENHALSLAAADLERARQYQVLHHIAWRQPVLAPNESVSIHVHSSMSNSEMFLQKALHAYVEQAAAVDTTLLDDPLNNLEETETPLIISNADEEPTTTGIDLNLGLDQNIMPTTDDNVIEVPVNADESIANDDKPAMKLDGLVRISLSRYLHLSADLTLSREILVPELPLFFQQEEETAPDQNLIVVRENPESEFLPSLENTFEPFTQEGMKTVYKPFRMLESRRMRSKEVHYLDHPAFGIVALITPYERALPSEEEEDTAIENMIIGAN